eukprot:XP_008680199.1 probable E3 ubiquitin-protein ligase RHC2A [Zea mays]
MEPAGGRWCSRTALVVTRTEDTTSPASDHGDQLVEARRRAPRGDGKQLSVNDRAGRTVAALLGRAPRRPRPRAAARALHHPPRRRSIDSAPAASIEAVPTVEVSEPGETRAICKEDLPLAAAARRLPCRHLYHSPSIVPWLELRNSCPICRCRLPSDSEHDEQTGELATPTSAPAQEQDPLPAAPADLQLPYWAAVSGAEGEETIVLPSV